MLLFLFQNDFRGPDIHTQSHAREEGGDAFMDELGDFGLQALFETETVWMGFVILEREVGWAVAGKCAGRHRMHLLFIEILDIQYSCYPHYNTQWI